MRQISFYLQQNLYWRNKIKIIEINVEGKEKKYVKVKIIGINVEVRAEICYFVKVKWSTYFLGRPIAYRCFVILSSDHFSYCLFKFYTHHLLEHILFIKAFFRLYYIICIFVIHLLFHFPFTLSSINRAMPNCTRCLCTIIVQSIFPFPSIANTNMFVYMCCCIDPLPSAAAAVNRLIQSVIANCYTLLRTIYVCTMYMHCNLSLLPFSIILKSKHCVLYICNGIMPLLPLSY